MMGFLFCKQLLHSQLTRGKDDAIPPPLVSCFLCHGRRLSHWHTVHRGSKVLDELVTCVQRNEWPPSTLMIGLARGMSISKWDSQLSGPGTRSRPSARSNSTAPKSWDADARSVPLPKPAAEIRETKISTPLKRIDSGRLFLAGRRVSSCTTTKPLIPRLCQPVDDQSGPVYMEKYGRPPNSNSSFGDRAKVSLNGEGWVVVVALEMRGGGGWRAGSPTLQTWGRRAAESRSPGACNSVDCRRRVARGCLERGWNFYLTFDGGGGGSVCPAAGDL